MTTDTGEPTLTIDELAARAGVTVRTVRFYGTKGLLPPPVIGPRRVGHYGRGHLARLELIEEMQRQGMTLAAIERHLRQLPAGLGPHDLAIHRAVVASWAPDTVETVSRAELERRAGRRLAAAELDRLAAMDVVTPDGESFRVDCGLLRLAVRLLDVPLAQETILAARTVLTGHARAAAHELSDLLREAVAERDTQDVRSLSAHMHPLVVQALLTTFQRSLREELRQWLNATENPPEADDTTTLGATTRGTEEPGTATPGAATSRTTTPGTATSGAEGPAAEGPEDAATHGAEPDHTATPHADDQDRPDPTTARRSERPDRTDHATAPSAQGSHRTDHTAAPGTERPDRTDDSAVHHTERPGPAAPRAEGLHRTNHTATSHAQQPDRADHTATPHTERPDRTDDSAVHHTERPGPADATAAPRAE